MTGIFDPAIFDPVIFDTGDGGAGGGDLQIVWKYEGDDITADADALAVHSVVGGFGGGDYRGQLVGFDGNELVGCDSFNLRDDEMWALLLNERAESSRVGHVDDVSAVGDLLRWGIRVAINHDRLDAEALEFDNNFFAKLAAPKKHDADGGV